MICFFVTFYLILKTLGKNVHSYSEDILELHRKFSLLLGAQFLSSFVYLFIPVFAAITANVIFNRSNKLVVQIFLFGIIFYGFTNSLLSIIFISSYRKHFIKFVSFSWLKPLLGICGFQSCCMSNAVGNAPTMVVTTNNPV